MIPIVRTVVFAVLCTVLLPVAPSPPAAAAPPCWHPPADAWVIDPFREPPCPWCAGNRGIDFGVAGTQRIRAVGGGVVTFAGSVAGTTYVVIEHPDGWKLTYGRLVRIDVGRGDHVASGATIGLARARFFFGLRVDGAYRDPWPYLGTLRGRQRLVPIDGTPARAAPPASLVCHR